MCRFYGFRASEPTKVECTLVHAQNALMIQSRLDQSGASHTDGWGVGFYHDHLPEVERRASAAHEDLLFSATAERVYSETVLAHVRKATVGVPALANCHPFRHGVWLFAHNGTVEGFDRVARRLEQEADRQFWQLRAGTTDSEAVFLWLLSRMDEAGIDARKPVGDLARLVTLIKQAVRDLAAWSAEVAGEMPSKLNFLISDGTSLVATRWNRSLYCVKREGIHDCEICGIPHVHHDTRARYRAVVLASEPISHERWEEVPEATLLAVDPGVATTVSPI